MVLAKVTESLGAAQVCFDRGYYNSSVSRAYYAMFQAAQAALTDAGVHRAEWSHAAVQAVFSSELTCRRKIYRVDLARNLAKDSSFA